MFLVSEAAVLITLQELEFHRIVVSKTYASGALDYHGAEFRQQDPLNGRRDARRAFESRHLDRQAAGPAGQGAGRRQKQPSRLPFRRGLTTFSRT